MQVVARSCHPKCSMGTSQLAGKSGIRAGGLVLGIDTCGPSGSVALGLLVGDGVELLGQTELAGRSYSATVVTAVGELLKQSGVGLRELAAIIAVNGPGSFTGVRVGLSAVKGLAEPFGVPVAVVSRLEVLAGKAGTRGVGVMAAALDAHRHEVFLRVEGPDALRGAKVREILAGQAELAGFEVRPAEVAVCDDAAAEMIRAAWPGILVDRVDAPTAGDALELAVPKIWAGSFVDLALLDGHYLRRSDAEIFGEPVQASASRA
jgi:tRNA threonylcarbamoyladenosine biosynthesis protein TsaB